MEHPHLPEIQKAIKNHNKIYGKDENRRIFFKKDDHKLNRSELIKEIAKKFPKYSTTTNTPSPSEPSPSPSVPWHRHSVLDVEDLT
ncbi:hypothetical protein DFA_04268 [Cavenderia fasciculata]|uniref:Uncharacterized protein n=1 Tax=Cavenderia fasciculata TaxID=261658 RepID=F4PP37_CACFS|nr:uncharacterized protein DFA_04268 [Cavenderia fasciculata]EGG22150.1 hypothetical protein DFA_04268 [Cavenderia fasciculata]|eukprot:XP_004360001.1 hypothetical protein DFA_04268 [Cavenderia fasciculata]